jgi:hypothetical protein
MNSFNPSTINEIERLRINNLYFPMEKQERNYVFESLITVDGKYVIFKDEVFDIVEQKLIGNVWSSLDVFKLLFEKTNIEDEQFKTIKESFLSMPILENHQNLFGLRDILLEFNFFQDTWFGRELSSAGESIKNFAKDSYNGLKKFGLAISSGDWSQILGLLASGIKFLLRKLKDALYSNIGMIVDAILIATGIGKGAQMVAWGLVVALDIYQISTGDFSDEDKAKPMWAKYLELGIDILGFLFTGAVAKTSKSLLSPLLNASKKGPAAVAAVIKKSPKIKELILKMIDNVGAVSGKLKGVTSKLQKTFPKASSFIGTVLGGMSGVLTAFVNGLKSIISGTKSVVKTVTGGAGKVGKAVRAGGTTGGINYGIDSYRVAKDVDLSKTLIGANASTKADYTGIDF